MGHLHPLARHHYVYICVGDVCLWHWLHFCMQLMDGRKATGGRLEVRVRLREPLGGQDHQTVTERWLVLEESQVSATVAVSDIFVPGLLVIKN